MRRRSTFSNLQQAQKLLDTKTAIFWFRRDLRYEDNRGLFETLKENDSVQPIFIFDTNILDRLEDPSDARVTFIHDSLQRLNDELVAQGSTLLVLQGNPAELFSSLSAKAVYANHDYEPYGRDRDKTVAKLLDSRNIPFHTFKDIVVFEKDEVVKDDGTPYTVFTPYSRKWKQHLSSHPVSTFSTARFANHLKRASPLTLPSLEDLGFARSPIVFPERSVPMKVIGEYAAQRDFPGIKSTTRLGVHLRFGTVSIRKLVSIAQAKSETWLNELIWREFYHMILWHFPHVTERSFKPAYDRLSCRNDPAEFQRWREGKTGYPLVDAGMRELNATGFMHNRVRMVAASFLTKHLLIDWRWGEAYFAEKLLDFDLAANNGGWQWAAGTGCDAAPYFRVFNPSAQAEKFDPNMTYVRSWIPELGTRDYPAPMVDHSFARDRAIKSYQEALK